MALAGVHVACGKAGGSSVVGNASIPLLGPLFWSETMASPATTSKAAPSSEGPNSVIMSVRSSAAVWIAIGPNPNAMTGPRRYLPADTDLDIVVNGGDKLAWVAA